MASEPKRRHSKGRKRVRRAAIKLAAKFVKCKNCGKMTISHTVCKECGYYGGGQVFSSKKVQVTKA